ncbi:MAG: PqqD family protein [Pseudomonadota bacterium]
MSLQQLTQDLARGRLRLTTMDDGSAVLLDAEGEALFSLNKTARFVVEQVRDGAETLDELAKRLAEAFEVDLVQAREDAQSFIDELTATL